MRLLPRKLLLLSLIALAGCQRNDLGFDDYLTRLERVLDNDRQAYTVELPAKPAKHHYLPQSESRYGLFESYALKPCGVMTLIADHNNQLGKTAPPSQQLIYHHKLAFELRHCDDQLLDQAGIELKTAVLAEKQQQLPSYSAGLLLVSDEIWHNLDASEHPGYSVSPSLEQALVSLVTLKELFSDSDRYVAAASDNLESALQVLHQQRQPRKLHRAMVVATEGLVQATALLQSHQQPICNRPEFDVLNNILHQIYAKRIQPTLAQMQRLDRQIADPLQQVLSPWPDEAYFNFYLTDQPGSLRAQFYHAIKQHSVQWQQLLTSCDATPNGKNFAMSSS